MYLSIGQAAKTIGVSISTLRRWEDEGRIKPDYRTPGGHRRYSIAYLNSEILDIPEEEDNSRKVYCYARVSSNDQKMDLLRQEKVLSKYCKDKSYDYEVISDLGSGINFKKKVLNKLIDLICRKKISKLILTHKDRLLRFGSALLFKLCAFFGTKVIVLNEIKTVSFEQELANDVIEIMTVFTARMYGKRSHKNKKMAA